MNGYERWSVISSIRLVAVLVTGAGVDDGAAAPLLLALINPADFPRLTMIFGDNKYHNHALEAWLAEHHPIWKIEVKLRPQGTRGFQPPAKRWVIERTNAWNGRCRCDSKDYERTVESSVAMIQVSNVHLLLRRLTDHPRPPFHYAAAAQKSQENQQKASG